MSRMTILRKLGWCLPAALLVVGTAAASWGHEDDQISAPLPTTLDGASGWLAEAPAKPAVPRAAKADSAKSVAPKVAPAPATPPAPPPERQPPPPSDLYRSLFGRGTEAPPLDRLAGTPNMFGDLFNNVGGQMAFTSLPLPGTGTVDLPLAAGSRRTKIAENNNTLPQDRVYFLYNHFQNALDVDVTQLGPAEHRAFSVDRYTLGFEKTLWCPCWSVEVRMPLAGSTQFGGVGYEVTGGDVGNLSVNVKRLLYRSDSTAAAIGLGIDTPTGSDVQARVRVTELTVHDDAVHLLPYFGLLYAPTDRFFSQGFLQVDVPTNGNRIDFNDLISGPGTFGKLNEQTLLYLDLSTGYWLYRNPCACGLTGLAAVTELHYTTALQNTDVLTGLGTGSAFIFENFANRVDIVNLTVGLHAEIAGSTLCRVAGVFPLTSGDNRSFDAEVQVQLERRF